MALKHFVLGGKNISYSDTGAGAETVILIHCSGASHRIFNRLIEALSIHYRVLAPDLAGYGASESWPVNEAFHYQFDVNIIKRLVGLSSTPVHLVGYSYGGFLALEASLICSKVRSLLLLEPAVLHLLHSADDPRLQKEVHAVGERFIKYAKSGQTRRAARSYIVYWAGYLRWLLIPRRIKNTIQRSVSKTAMEFTSVFEASTDLSQYQGLECPVLLIAGSHTRESAKTVVRILDQSFAHSQCIWLKGANHMSLLQHNDVTEIVMQWLGQAQVPNETPSEKSVENVLEVQ